MSFENIVISPPDSYRFLNFVSSVINLLYFQIGKKKEKKEDITPTFRKCVHYVVKW